MRTEFKDCFSYLNSFFYSALSPQHSALFITGALAKLELYPEEIISFFYSQKPERDGGMRTR